MQRLKATLYLAIFCICTTYYAHGVTLHFFISDFDHGDTPFSLSIGDTVKLHWVSGEHNISGTVPDGALPFATTLTGSSTTYTYAVTHIGDYTITCADITSGVFHDFFDFTALCPRPAVAVSPEGPLETCADGGVFHDLMLTASVDPPEMTTTFTWLRDGHPIDDDISAVIDGNTLKMMTINGVYSVMATRACGSSDTSEGIAVTLFFWGASLDVSYTNTGLTYTFYSEEGEMIGDPMFWDFGDGTPGSGSSVHTYTSPGTYIVTVTQENEGGCVALGQIEVNVPVSVDEVKKDKPYIITHDYNRDIINVKATGVFCNVQVLDLNGRPIRINQVSTLDPVQIDLANLASGLYLVSIKTDQGIYTEKISIMH